MAQIAQQVWDGLSGLLSRSIVVSLLVLAGCSTMAESARQAQAKRGWNDVRARVKLQLARQRYDAGLFEDAARTAAESIALDGSQEGAYVLTAKAHLERSKPASAQRVLDLARQAGLHSAGLHYMQGVILEQRGRLEDAVAEYEEARRADPTNVDHLIAEAECLVALDRPDQAVTLLSENAGRGDDHGAALVLKAHIAALRGDPDAALTHFHEAFTTLGDSRLIAEELGLLLVRQRRYREAVTVLQPLIEPPTEGLDCGTVRRALATCHLALNDPSTAKAVLAAYARLHQGDALAQLLIAKAAIATGDLVTALHATHLARQGQPGHPEVLLVDATLRWRRGDLDAAASLLGEILSNNPRDVDAHCLLAEVLQDRHRDKAARDQFQRALQIDTQCSWAIAGLNSLPAPNPPQTEPRP